METGSLGRSSFVNEAWYDGESNYMITQLKGTNHHYCRLPSQIWSALVKAKSHGRYYGQKVRGNFDCRLGGARQAVDDV